MSLLPNTPDDRHPLRLWITTDRGEGVEGYFYKDKWWDYNHRPIKGNVVRWIPIGGRI